MLDAGRLAARRHLFYGFMEADVTLARQALQAHKARTGETLSFTAFLVGCLGRAIDQHKLVHAYRDWRGRLVLFDEVDVVTLIETEKGGVALPHILRAANRKSFLEIHQEIRSIQARPKRSPQKNRLTSIGVHAPAFVRDLFYWAVRRDPRWIKQIMGTTLVTSVGMFGGGSFYGLPFLPFHTFGLTVGGSAEKPGVVAGEIQIREILCLTLAFDHDIVDGAPAVRFGQELKRLVESAAGLEAFL